MQNSQSFDVPMLTNEIEKKLLRVFCFLRQLEKKARLKKKLAEFHTAVMKHHCQRHAQLMVQHQQDQRERQERHDQESKQNSSKVESPMSSSASGTALSPTMTAEASPASKTESNTTANQQLNDCTAGPITNSKESSQPPADSPDLETIQAVLGDTENFFKTCGPELNALHKEVEDLKKSILVKDNDSRGYVTAADLTTAMKSMSRPVSKGEVHWMIWEVDNDLDGAIDWDDFRGAYSRSIHDKHNLEPNQLYHVIQFLLCDRENSFSVSVLEITDELRRHVGTQQVASNLLDFFAVELRERDRKLSLAEYLDLVLDDLPSAGSWKCDNV